MLSNPFAVLTEVFSPLVMQIYVVLMALAVAAGTLFDTYHKGSAIFFAQRRARAQSVAEKQLTGGEKIELALATIGEAAVSGEFCKWPRRASHLLMMYGFLLYVISTIVIVFGYPGSDSVPAILPSLWTLGATMLLVGGLWFFLFLRVNVTHDGASPFHLGRADLFIGSLIGSSAFALVWRWTQAAYAHTAGMWVAFGLYMLFTTLLFLSVFWSKFAHMFFKPVVAYQRRVEEADGSSDLPRPSTENYIVRS